MQIKLFTVSIGDEGKQQEDLNAFLRGNKVLDVRSTLYKTNVEPIGAFVFGILKVLTHPLVTEICNSKKKWTINLF